MLWARPFTREILKRRSPPRRAERLIQRETASLRHEVNSQSKHLMLFGIGNDGRTEKPDRERRRHRRADLDPGRERNRKGARGPGGRSRVVAAREAVREGQLRRLARRRLATGSRRPSTLGSATRRFSTKPENMVWWPTAACTRRSGPGGRRVRRIVVARVAR
jgi:hypothetical protein